MTKDYQPNKAIRILFEEEPGIFAVLNLAEDEDEEETCHPPNLFPTTFYFLPTYVFCIPHFDHRIRQWVLVPLRSFGQQKSKNDRR